MLPIGCTRILRNNFQEINEFSLIEKIFVTCDEERDLKLQRKISRGKRLKERLKAKNRNVFVFLPVASSCAANIHNYKNRNVKIRPRKSAPPLTTTIDVENMFLGSKYPWEPYWKTWRKKRRKKWRKNDVKTTSKMT